MIKSSLRGVVLPLENMRLLKWLERVHPAALIFVVLCLNRIAVTLNGGEEHYLAYALQHYNPDWIRDSFTYNEFPGTRLLFQTITGFFVDKFGFQTTAVAGRILVFALSAFPLARIFRYFNLPNYAVLIIVQLFLLNKQSFFADEWIFWGFEPKALAYIFIFWGLLLFFERRYTLMAVALACSAWFHLLVGGWFFAGSLIAMLILKVRFRELAVSVSVFLAMMLPLILYLWPLLSFNNLNLNLNYIYVYFRLKHHLGIFYSYDYFIGKHLGGVTIAFLVLLAQFPLICRSGKGSFRSLSILNAVFLSIALFFVVIAWMDLEFFNRSGGFGLKYYPFRMMSISLFITVMQIIWLLRFRLRHLVWCNGIMFVLLILSFVALGVRTGLRVDEISRSLKPDLYLDEFVREVKKASSPGDVFVIMNPDYPTATTFSRLTRRENYVVFKYVPAGTEKLAEWYRRLKVVRFMSDNPRLMYKTAVKENISFILAREQVNDPGLRLIWPSALYFLYEVIPQEKNEIPSQTVVIR